MGKKARATQGKIMKPALVSKSPSQVQAVAAAEIPLNTSSDLPMSETSPSFRKKSKTPTTIIRRSQRLRSTATNQQTEPVIQEISISESEEEEEPPQHEDRNTSHDEPFNESERSSQKDSVAEIYKNMYIDSQKKIEELAVENRQLCKKLDHALGKVDVYEKQVHIYSEVMAIISSLSKANENFSTHCFASEDVELEGGISKKKKCA